MGKNNEATGILRGLLNNTFKYGQGRKLVSALFLSAMFIFTSCTHEFCSTYANKRQKLSHAKEQIKDSRRSYIPSPISIKYKSAVVRRR